MRTPRSASTRRVLLALSFVFIGLTSSAQGVSFDSLRNIVGRHSSDTLAVLACADLCYGYRMVNQDSALYYAEQGMTLARKLNYRKGLAQVSSDAALVHYDRGDLDSAISLWSSALKVRLELQDKPGIASLRMKIGAAYFRKGEYDESLRHQLDALRTYEELNVRDWIGQTLSNVAAVYEQQNLLEKALEYYQRAYDLHESDGSPAGMARVLINIGNVHFLQKDYAASKKCLLSALRMLPQGTEATNKAVALNNLSEIFATTEKYDSAAICAEQALSIRRATGEIGGVISSLNMLGRIATHQSNYVTARKFLDEALALATEKQLLSLQSRVYHTLYELHKEQGSWKQGLEAHERFAAIRDSLLNETSRKEVAAMQVKYDTEKKEQQISLQAAELAQKQTRIERDTVIILALVVAVALSIVILVLLRGRQRRRAEMQRKEGEIALREAFIRASIESQENERKRFARDLHDGMGQWISSLRLVLEALQDARDDAERIEVLDRADKIMGDINHEFRSIAFNLMPHTLIHYGLKAALGEMVNRLNTMNQAVFSVTAFAFPERLPELVEVSLYRVVQEWTNNILKYSDATRVEIQLTGHDDELVILIEDNGRGFNVDVLKRGAGNGWNNIRSRMNLIKGSVDVDSANGRTGTTLSLMVPRLAVDPLPTGNHGAVLEVGDTSIHT